MINRRFFLFFALLVSLPAALLAQSTQQEYYDKYLRLTSRLGYDGVGMETYIDRWEEAFPQDGRMLEAKSNYFYAKSVHTEAVVKDKSRYLGNPPLMTLKDSLGRDVNFFEEDFFDDALFAQAVSAIDKAIELYPDDLAYRADKISLLLAYEKESPDLARKEIESLLAYQKKSHPAWVVSGTAVAESDFVNLMSGYCYRLYNCGSPVGYEAFGSISMELSKMYPKETVFLDNIGSYYLVCKGNERKAVKYYKKALKLDPDDKVAQTNMSIIERRKAKK